jgi:hypothetical protein
MLDLAKASKLVTQIFSRNKSISDLNCPRIEEKWFGPLFPQGALAVHQFKRMDI